MKLRELKSKRRWTVLEAQKVFGLTPRQVYQYLDADVTGKEGFWDLVVAKSSRRIVATQCEDAPV